MVFALRHHNLLQYQLSFEMPLTIQRFSNYIGLQKFQYRWDDSAFLAIRSSLLPIQQCREHRVSLNSQVLNQHQEQDGSISQRKGELSILQNGTSDWCSIQSSFNLVSFETDAISLFDFLIKPLR